MGLVIEVQEATEEWAEEAHSLFLEHNEELGLSSDIPLDIDFDKYFSLRDSGNLLIMCARIDGELVGYLIYILTTAPMYKGSLQAYQDTLFIKKDKRKSLLGCGYFLIKHSESVLKDKGVQIIQQHVELKHDFSSFLEKLDYEYTGKVYEKRLF